MPDKLTDSEIVKALELMLDRIRAYECNNVSINKNLITNILDLINRLQAENERLKGCVKSEDEVREIAKRTMEPLVKQITREQIDIAVKLAKAEAYKEILNFLGNKFVCKGKLTAMGYESAIIDIKNHLKELVGE